MPDQTSSSEYVQTRPSKRFSHSWLPTASTAAVSPSIRHALMRVDPSSMPSDVRPAWIASALIEDSPGSRRSSPDCP